MGSKIGTNNVIKIRTYIFLVFILILSGLMTAQSEARQPGVNEPEDTLGYFGSTAINEFGDTYAHIHWGKKQSKWSWHSSAGYEDFEDSNSAGAGRYTSGVPSLNALIGFNTYYVFNDEVSGFGITPIDTDDSIAST